MDVLDGYSDGIFDGTAMQLLIANDNPLTRSLWIAADSNFDVYINANSIRVYIQMQILSQLQETYSISSWFGCNVPVI